MGEGAAGRASRSPGCAARSRACGPRAAGIPGRGASEANEFPAAGAGTAPAGGGERGPGTLEPLYPANQGKEGEWTPSNARVSPHWAEAGGLPVVLREGEIILSGARVLRGQVRKGVTLPFLVSDPIVSVASGPGRLRNTC